MDAQKCVFCDSDASITCPNCPDSISRFCCQEHLAEHQLTCLTRDTHEIQAPAVQELLFFIRQLYLILKPVTLCIALSILWVKLANPSPEYWETGLTNIRDPSLYIPGSSGVGTVSAVFDNNNQQQVSLSDSAIIAIVFVCEIVVATFVLLCLFHFKQIKVLYGFIMLTVLFLLGYFGYSLFLELLTQFNTNFDYFTFFFFIWNWTAVGIAVIFYKGPMLLQQMYLVVMSSLMAYNFSTLPSLVTWILLALLGDF
jgi:presenilin 1